MSAPAHGIGQLKAVLSCVSSQLVVTEVSALAKLPLNGLDVLEVFLDGTQVYQNSILNQCQPCFDLE